MDSDKSLLAASSFAFKAEYVYPGLKSQPVSLAAAGAP
jgi:hypothetical protein